MVEAPDAVEPEIVALAKAKNVAQEELAKVIDKINDCVGLKGREEQAVTRYLTETAQAGRAGGTLPGP